MLNLTRKQAIAALAASLVGAEDTIVIDTGTTALQLARALPTTFQGRVLTNSVLVAAELSDRSNIGMMLCGGQIRPGDGACSGAHAEAFFANVYADKAFLGAGGVHPEAGLTDYYPAEAAIRRTIAAHSAAVYVMADTSKLGVIAIHRVCPLEQVTAVLTDEEENTGALAALTANVTLLRAAVNRQSSLTAAG